MPCVRARNLWCDINFLHVRTQTGDKSDDTRDNFYEELERVFD